MDRLLGRLTPCTAVMRRQACCWLVQRVRYVVFGDGVVEVELYRPHLEELKEAARALHLDLPPQGRELVAAIDAMLAGAETVSLKDKVVRELYVVLCAMQSEQGRLNPHVDALRIEAFRRGANLRSEHG